MSKVINSARLVRRDDGAMLLALGRGRVIGLPEEGEDALSGVRKADNTFILPPEVVESLRDMLGDPLALAIEDGDALDLAINQFRNDVLRPKAIEALGLVPAVAIPPGKYSISAADSTITMEPFDGWFTQGNTLVAFQNAAQRPPVIWIRNDVVPYMTQGENIGNTAPSPTAEANYANHKIIDGSRGTLILAGSGGSTTGVCLRIGNADGVWGSPNFTGGNHRTVHLQEISHVHIMYVGIGIQLTNNNAFCANIDQVWVSSTAIGIQTSPSNAETNAYEMHRFTRYFSGNINDTHIECNSTGNRDHQIALVHSSLTFCAGPAIRWNTGAENRLELTSGRIENFTVVLDARVVSPRSWLVLTGMCIIPTNTIRAQPLTTHLRKMFKSAAGGQSYTIQATNTRFDITGTPPWSTDEINDLANFFLADENVMVDAVNTWAIEPVGGVADNNGMRNQPIWNSSQSLIPNWAFAADGAGWTLSLDAGVTATYTSAANEFYFGTRGLRLAFTGNTGKVTTRRFRVEPGKMYYADTGGRYDSGGTTQLYLIFTWTWLDEDGNEIGVPEVTPHSTQQNWFNRKSATRFVRHPTGSLRRRAPAGAAWATVTVDFSSSPLAKGGAVTGTFFLAGIIPIKQS